MKELHNIININIPKSIIFITMISSILKIIILFLIFFYFIFLNNSFGMMSTTYLEDCEKHIYSYKSSLSKPKGIFPILVFKNENDISQHGLLINDVANNNGFICILNPSKEKCIYLQDFLHEDYQYMSGTNFDNFDIFLIKKSLMSGREDGSFVIKRKDFKESIGLFLDEIQNYGIMMTPISKIFEELEKEIIIKDINDYNNNKEKKLPLFINVKY